ncbi:transposase family protein [Shewanella sp. SHSM-M6]|uniref:Transposase family protein n=1 Tax=Shewanella salipaludis TaxID=2723052 RepID=A0A972JJT7_9GAMM|nr:transposase family protein [Shewanella salipaludis]
MSERRAYLLFCISRTATRYVGIFRDDEAVKSRLKELAVRYPRYGYLLLHGLLKAEGLVDNKKRTYRLYTELGLQVRTKQRKKLIRPRIPISLPNGINERWSMGFVSDQLASGRRFRVLNIVDDYSRECIGQLADVSLSGEQVSRFLKQLIAQRQRPQSIVYDRPA